MKLRPALVIFGVITAAALTTAIVVRLAPKAGAPGGEPPADAAGAAASEDTLAVSVTATGAPVPGAVVRVYAALPAPDGSEARWRLAAEAPTGRDGMARMPLARGAYVLAVRAPGLATTLAEVLRVGGLPAHVDVALERPVQLAGRVRTLAGAPVPGARIRAIPFPHGLAPLGPPHAPGEEIAAGISGTDGAFRLAGLAPGTHALTVDAPGFHPVLVPRAELPAAALSFALEPLGSIVGVVRSGGRAAPGAVVRGGSADHEATAVADAEGRFTLSAPAGSYALVASDGRRAGALPSPVAVLAGAAAGPANLELGRASTITGDVERPEGPAAGAEVVAFLHGTRAAVAAVRTDAEGRFRLAGLAPGTYDVRARALGAGPALVRGVTVARGARFVLRLALPAGGTVEGTVRDPNGSALASVRVRAISRGGGVVPASAVETRTDFEGRYRLAGLEPGSAEVVARQDGVMSGVALALAVDAGKTRRADLVLAAPGSLEGRVTRGGDPLPAGTTVVATSLRAGADPVQAARAATDERGRYRLVLPAGDYRVHAVAGDATSESRAIPSFPRVEPGRASRLDLALARGGEEGPDVVVREPGGAPSPGALVSISRAGEALVAFAAFADGDGRVTLPQSMGMAGTGATLRARNGGRTAELTTVLPATGTIALPLAPGGTLTGLVREAPRRPVAGFSVEIAAEPGAGRWREADVHRFVGDRFELGDLPPEPLRITVRTDDGRLGAARVQVGPGERRSVEIRLR